MAPCAWLTSGVIRRYKEGGPAAEARFEAGVAGFEARAFRGCGIFTSEPVRLNPWLWA
jgi:hypothetical protein|tara:strand:- start:438 stop:611 length:174 start_codon:yes stop_codon:yes gene_type:complete